MTGDGWRRYDVPAGLEGERVDSAIARLTGLSRTKAAELVDSQGVRLDGRATSRSQRMLAGMTVEVRLDPPQASEAARTPQGRSQAPDSSSAGSSSNSPGDSRHNTVELSLLFEDDALVVIDKPVGVAAHSSPGWTGPTVTDILRARGVGLAVAGAAERQGIVHRLDVGTSGVMVVAKTERAYSELKRQFKARTVVKIYHALVQGHPDPSRGTIDAPIGRHPHRDYRFAVVAGGRDSITHYRTLEAFRRASLLEVALETGRTHQIRVHMAAVRHPCCGDLTYGADPTLAAQLRLERQWLHAVALEIDHPSHDERMRFESRYSPDLAAALQTCRSW